ncbi:GAF domain-containing protein [bacterium]|nr:GAF domain-containing protein [bacterium]
MIPTASCPEVLHQTLEGLLEISNLVGSVMLLDDILDRIVQIASGLIGVPVCSIYLLDDQGRAVLRSTWGLESDLKGKVVFEPGQGIVGTVLQTRQTVALEDSTRDPRYRPLPSSLSHGYRAYICTPMLIRDELVGVMTARKSQVYAFNHDEIIFFETICKQVAILIEKARIYDDKIQAERLAAVAVSLSGVAHYIKNVLLTMQGGEYLVERGIEQGALDRIRDGWSVLKRANGKIRGLVENILNYCRQNEPNFRRVDLNAMILDMVQTIGDSARERKVELATSLDPQVGEVWVDSEQIYDGLLNLVTNAIDAIPDGRGGRVRILTERLEGRHQVLIDVSDDGTGIPEDVREKIFNLFFSTKGRKGTGIGLAATRKIVQDHGGTIELTTVPGEGTTFSIYLPTNANDMTHAAPVAGE